MTVDVHDVCQSCRSRDSIKVGTALRNAADLLRTPLGFLKCFLSLQTASIKAEACVRHWHAVQGIAFKISLLNGLKQMTPEECVDES